MVAVAGALRVASLFSGTGGLDLGLQQAGHEVSMAASLAVTAWLSAMVPWQYACARKRSRAVPLVL
jgi:hypothetical protein